MVIGLLVLEIHLPFCHSLKEKRKHLKSFRDRLRNRYNVAFAELEYQDKWQRARIGLVTLNSEKKVVDSLLQKILRDADDSIDGEIIHSEILHL